MTDPIPAVEALREAIRLLLRDFDRDPTDDYLDLAVPKFQQRLTPAQPVTETTDLRAASVPDPSDAIRIGVLVGTLFHRAWLMSGRADPLLDADAWDGFALTVQALIRVERITIADEYDRAARATLARQDTPASGGLDVDVLYRAMVNVDTDDPGVFDIIGISEPETRPVAEAVAREYARLTSEAPREEDPR